MLQTRRSEEEEEERGGGEWMGESGRMNDY